MQYCSWLNYSVVVRTNIHWTASNPKAGCRFGTANSDLTFSTFARCDTTFLISFRTTGQDYLYAY